MSHDNENKKGCMCGCGGDANNRYCQTHHCSEMCRQYNGGKSARDVIMNQMLENLELSNYPIMAYSTPPSEEIGKPLNVKCGCENIGIMSVINKKETKIVKGCPIHDAPSEVSTEKENNLEKDELREICRAIYRNGYRNASEESQGERGDWSGGYEEIKKFIEIAREEAKREENQRITNIIENINFKVPHEGMNKDCCDMCEDAYSKIEAQDEILEMISNNKN